MRGAADLGVQEMALSLHMCVTFVMGKDDDRVALADFCKSCAVALNRARRYGCQWPQAFTEQQVAWYFSTVDTTIKELCHELWLHKAQRAMQLVVSRHLRDIKARLWRPEGRLAQAAMRAALADPVSSSGSTRSSCRDSEHAGTARAEARGPEEELQCVLHESQEGRVLAEQKHSLLLRIDEMSAFYWIISELRHQVRRNLRCSHAPSSCSRFSSVRTVLCSGGCF